MYSTTSPFHVSPAAGNPVAVEDTRALQPEATPSNELGPTVVGALPSNSMLERLPQLANAASSIVVTPSPIVTFVRPLQSKNVQYPMLFTLPGIVTLSRVTKP